MSDTPRTDYAKDASERLLAARRQMSSVKDRQTLMALRSLSDALQAVVRAYEHHGDLIKQLIQESDELAIPAPGTVPAVPQSVFHMERAGGWQKPVAPPRADQRPAGLPPARGVRVPSTWTAIAYEVERMARQLQHTGDADTVEGFVATAVTLAKLILDRQDGIGHTDSMSSNQPQEDN